MAILAFGSYKFQNMLKKFEPSVSKQSFKRDLDQEPSMIPSEYGFNIAFGFLSMEGDLDPTYGQFVAN